MRLMWLLATRNWSSSPGRSLASVLSVALGVAVVVTVTSFHETGLRTLRKQVVDRWLGTAHILIHPPDAHWGALDARVADRIRPLENVARVTVRLSRRVRVAPHVHAQQLIPADWGRAQAIGIDPEVAPSLALTSLTGRAIGPGDRHVVVMERETAADCGVALGGTLRIVKSVGGEPLELTVEGFEMGECILRFRIVRKVWPEVVSRIAARAQLCGDRVGAGPTYATAIDHQCETLARLCAEIVAAR